MFEKIIKEIENASRIIIHRHSNPDGDALGSQTGLKYLILENYPEKEVYSVGDASKRLSFIEGSASDEVPDDYYKDALAIVLDTSGRTLINDHRYEKAKRTVRIDHHIFIEQICDEEVTDTTAESCAGMIAAMAKEANWKMPLIAATALYTGMVTDSGRFRYDSTNYKTFALASYLLEQQPVDISKIYAELYADDFERVKLRAAFILKIQFTKNNVAFIYTTREEIEKMKADTYAISRGMVGTMADIRSVDIWVNFTEIEEGVICEIRSSKYNINPIAVKYGGGGHAKASGATVKNREEAMLMLDDLDRMCEVQ